MARRSIFQMNDVTYILNRIGAGDATAIDELLPLVYQELRRLANHKVSREPPGQSLQATELVHEAYLRLVGANTRQQWDSKGHFFSAAAEAMRRILVEQARRTGSAKRRSSPRRCGSTFRSCHWPHRR